MHVMHVMQDYLRHVNVCSAGLPRSIVYQDADIWWSVQIQLDDVMVAIEICWKKKIKTLEEVQIGIEPWTNQNLTPRKNQNLEFLDPMITYQSALHL